MKERTFNVEGNFTGDKWEYLSRWYTLPQAIKYASQNYVKNKTVSVRIREVVKTVVWKDGKLTNGRAKARSQTKKTQVQDG